jgi:hypothetical protein
MATGGDMNNVIDLETGQVKRTIRQIFEVLGSRQKGVMTAKEAAGRLEQLSSRNKNYEEFTQEFETLFALTGRSEDEKSYTFYSKLPRNLQDKIGTTVEVMDWDFNKLFKSGKERHQQLDYERSRAERQRGGGGRGRGGKSSRGPTRANAATATTEGSETRTCFYCEKTGHLKKDCRKWKADNPGEVTRGRGRGGRGTSGGRAAKQLTQGEDDRDIHETDTEE